LIVSNTAGALSYDRQAKLAAQLEASTGVAVLAHRTKKPGCGAEIMDYFRSHPETGVQHPSEVAVVGDRLATDIMMANMMGSWGFWVRDGVVPLSEKSAVSTLLSNVRVWCADRKQFSRFERRLADSLIARGYRAQDPVSPFE